jgi:hypothetical protein
MPSLPAGRSNGRAVDLEVNSLSVLSMLTNAVPTTPLKAPGGCDPSERVDLAVGPGCEQVAMCPRGRGSCSSVIAVDVCGHLPVDVRS